METITVPHESRVILDEGAGMPVLLVHGFPLSHAMWRHQVEALKANYRVIAPDLLGFGSSAARRDKLTMDEFADDLAEVLNDCQVREPVVFVGLSMGGYIGWQFWRKYRNRVRALVLCDTRAVSDTPEAAKGRLATADKVLQEGAQVVAEAMLPKLVAKQTSENQPQLVDELKQTILARSPYSIAAALRGMAERIDATPYLEKMSVPTLVMVGRHDAISTPDEMRSIAEAIPGAQFVEVPDAGHMSPLENPVVFNAELREFLATLG
jgi:pimeloyl-ACP methyl ester carboxylesterase